MKRPPLDDEQLWKALVRRCNPDDGCDRELAAWVIAVAGVVLWGDSPESMGMCESARLPEPEAKAAPVVDLQDWRRGSA